MNIKEILAHLGEEHYLTGSERIGRYFAGLNGKCGLKNVPVAEVQNKLAAVALPQSRQQLAVLSQRAAGNGLKLVTHGDEAAGATDDATAGDRGAGIWVDLGGLSRIVSLDRESQIVEVEAGITPLELERKLEEKNLSIGYQRDEDNDFNLEHYLSGFEVMSPYLKFDDAENICVALEFASAQGSLPRTWITPRSATGPGFKNLLLGGRHRLGLISSVVLKVFRRGPGIAESAFLLRSFKEGLSILRRLAQSDCRPQFARLFNENRTRDLISHNKAGGVLLYTLYEGHADLVDYSQRTLESLAGGMAGEPVAPESGMALIEQSGAAGSAFDIYISALWSRADELVGMPGRIMAGQERFYLAACRAWREGVLLFASLAADPDAGEDLSPDEIDGLYEKVAGACRKSGASILRVREAGVSCQSYTPDAVAQVFQHLDPS